ncbi:O-antigen ligase family protein [Nocardioides sp. AX2bis]|uniref:O-antigen ligase family protein n=1 Tax=Nocardioides sp. AX2bis TaxID=2653157 RepID=UPI00135A3C83|nr:hypothetical protein [Nocardioides sp. AX2bis]
MTGQAALPDIVTDDILNGIRATAVAAASVTFLRGTRPAHPLVWVFCLLPVTGALLAQIRGEPADAINHLASLLTVVMVSRMPRQVIAESALKALTFLIAASLALGLFYAPAVFPNERAFLRFLYDGRLTGLLGSANVLGEAAVLLAAAALLTLSGRRRLTSLTMAFVTIIATSSQTSAIVFVAILVAFVLAQGASTKAGLAAIQLFGIFAAFAALVAYFLASNLAGFLITEYVSQVTLSARTEIWDYVLNRTVIPTTGIGQGEIDVVFAFATIDGATGVGSLHSVFFDGYVRDGLIGLGAVLAAYVGAAWTIGKRRARAGWVPFIAWLLIGFVEVTPTHVPFYALFFGLILVGLGDRGVDQDEFEADPSAVEHLHSPRQGLKGGGGLGVAHRRQRRGARTGLLDDRS